MFNQGGLFVTAVLLGFLLTIAFIGSVSAEDSLLLSDSETSQATHVNTLVKPYSGDIKWWYPWSPDLEMFYRKYELVNAGTSGVYQLNTTGFVSEIYNETVSFWEIFVFDGYTILSGGTELGDVTFVYNDDFTVKKAEVRGGYVAFNPPYLLTYESISGVAVFTNLASHVSYNITLSSQNPADIIDFYYDDESGSLYLITDSYIVNCSLSGQEFEEQSSLRLSVGSGDKLLRVFKDPSGNIAVLQGGGRYATVNLTRIYDIASGNTESVMVNFNGQPYMFDTSQAQTWGGFKLQYVVFESSGDTSLLVLPIYESNSQYIGTGKISAVGFFKYNYGTGTYDLYRVINIFDALGSADYYYGYSFIYDSASDTIYFSATVSGWIDSDLYSFYYLIESTPSQQPPQQPPQETFYPPMEVLEIFGGVDRDYSVMRYVVNDTKGWIVAKAYEVVGEGADESSAGIAVFRTYFNGTDVNVDQTYFEQLAVGRPMYVYPKLSGDMVVIGGGGLSTENVVNDTALLLLYNVTENTLVARLYEGFLPIVYIGLTNRTDGSLVPFFVEANGSIVYILDNSTPPDPSGLDRTSMKVDIDSWNTNNTAGLVNGDYSYVLNETFLFAIAKDADTGNATLKIYKLVNDTIEDVTPSESKVVFAAKTPYSITISDAKVSVATSEGKEVSETTVYVSCLVVDRVNSTAYHVVFTNETGQWTLTVKNALADYELRRYVETSTGLAVAGGKYNTSSGMWFGIIHPLASDGSIDTTTTLTYLSLASSNAVLIDAYEFGNTNTVLAGISNTWSSPGAVAIAQTTTSSPSPIPEPWLLALATSLAAAALFLLKTRKQAIKHVR